MAGIGADEGAHCIDLLSADTSDHAHGQRHGFAGEPCAPSFRPGVMVDTPRWMHRVMAYSGFGMPP